MYKTCTSRDDWNETDRSARNTRNNRPRSLYFTLSNPTIPCLQTLAAPRPLIVYLTLKISLLAKRAETHGPAKIKKRRSDRGSPFLNKKRWNWTISERGNERERHRYIIWFIWVLKINEDSFGQKRQNERGIGISLVFSILVRVCVPCIVFCNV